MPKPPIHIPDRGSSWPEPCGECGSRVVVVGRKRVTPRDEKPTQWSPRLRCTNRECATNSPEVDEPLGETPEP